MARALQEAKLQREEANRIRDQEVRDIELKALADAKNTFLENQRILDLQEQLQKRTQ